MGLRPAHRTGTLAGVANDVAVLACPNGTLAPAFLAERRHDPPKSGGETGICRRGLLETLGLLLRQPHGLV